MNMITEISKIIKKRGHAEVHYQTAEQVKGGSESGREIKVSSDLVPHPDFTNAMDAFRFHAVRAIHRELCGDTEIEDFPEDAEKEMERLEIKSVEKSGDAMLAGVVITLTQKSFDGTKNQIKTGKIRTDLESSSYPFAEQLADDWDNLTKEAVAYVMGEKFSNPQMSLFEPPVEAELY